MVMLPPAKHCVLNLPETNEDSLELATAWVLLSWWDQQRSTDGGGINGYVTGL